MLRLMDDAICGADVDVGTASAAAAMLGLPTWPVLVVGMLLPANENVESLILI
jgi:hypothetical protein